MIDTNIIDGNDVGKDNITLLEDMIYETNHVRIPREHIVYGTPRPLDQVPDDPTDPNTYIDVAIDPLYDDRYVTLGGFMYRRQDLGDFFHDLNITITVTEFPFTLYSVWGDQVIPHLPFPISVQDIENYLFTDPTQLFLRIKAKDGAWLWSGTINLMIKPIDPTLFELVHTPYLSGFIEYRVGADPVTV